jgi:hypothetical protein
MKNKYELIAKYFSDLSKIWLTATVIKQFAERKFDLISFVGGVILSLVFLIGAILFQPTEE